MHDFLEGLMPGRENIIYWKNGLGIRVNKKSSVYVVKYYFAGKARWRKLASTKLITQDKAEQIAEQIKAHAQHGIDPEPLIVTLLDLQGLPKNSGISWKKFRSIYIDDIRERLESWQKVESRLRRHTAIWDNRALLSITKTDIKDLHKLITKGVPGRKGTPTEANRLLEDLSAAFKFAIEENFVGSTFQNPAKGVKRNKIDTDVTFIRKDQMKRIGVEIDKLPDSYQKWCIKLDFYLGLRISNCRMFRWEWIDMEEGLIYLPKGVMKRRTEHVLPITTPVRRLLESIPRKPDSPFVFPGKMNGTCIARVDKHWKKIRKAAGLEHLTVHSIRHTAGSWLLHQTGDQNLVGKVLHHSTQEATRIYAQHDTESIRSPMEDYALRMEAYLENPDRSDARAQ